MLKTFDFLRKFLLYDSSCENMQNVGYIVELQEDKPMEL